VTFYFTNFPEKVTHFQLCKVFVVYGLLENVYVAQKLNARGQRSGFARFSRVKEVTKLFYAITDIRFGQSRLWARVARFDKAPVEGAEKRARVKGGRDEGVKPGREHVHTSKGGKKK
jgi:hypothetical protein